MESYIRIGRPQLIAFISILMVVGFWYTLNPILMPFVVGILLAYLGDPLVDKLEEFQLNRTLAVTCVFVVLFTIVSIILLLVVPALARQLDSFILRLPQTLIFIQDKVLPYLDSTGIVSIERLTKDELTQVIQQNWKHAGNVVIKAFGQLSASGVAVVTWLANFLLIPVVSFYLLRDWDDIVLKVRKLLPRDSEPTVVKVAKDCDEVLSAFLRGQLMVMFALGTIYSIGLSFAGIELALLLGTLAGLASVVPYMGVIVGIGTSALAAYLQFHELSALVPVFIVFGIGQLLEGMVLTPLMVGDKIGLHPVAVIFAVMAGGQLAGFVGILVALPVAAVLLVVLKHWHGNYIQSRFYQETVDATKNAPAKAKLKVK